MAATATFSLTFIEQLNPIKLATATFSGLVGTPEAGTLVFSGGGGGPYTVTASSGLPPGITVTSTGIIGGTPTLAGTSTASITVVG